MNVYAFRLLDCSKFESFLCSSPESDGHFFFSSFFDNIHRGSPQGVNCLQIKNVLLYSFHKGNCDSGGLIVPKSKRKQEIQQFRERTNLLRINFAPVSNLLPRAYKAGALHFKLGKPEVPRTNLNLLKINFAPGGN
jgi:hypothetical protein